MKYYFKKTNELTENEVKEMVQLMNNNLFKDTTKFSINHFYKKYQNNFLGYSFHGFYKKDNQIIGIYFVLPEKFYFKTDFILAGQSVDTLIDKKFRGNLQALRNLTNLVYEEIKNNDIKFIYGIPNKNIYLIRKKLLGWNDIAYVNSYFLLKYSYLQNFLLFIKKILNNLINQNKELDHFETKDKSIKSYKDEVVKIKNTEFVFRTLQNNNKNYAYILKILPSKKMNIDEVFHYLKKKNYNRIVFLTNQNLTLDNAFKLPKIFNKNKILLCGKILDENNKQITYDVIRKFKFDLINLDIMNPN